MVILHLSVEREGTSRECNRHRKEVSCRFLYRSVCVVTVSREILDITPEVVPLIGLESCNLHFLDTFCRNTVDLEVCTVCLYVSKRVTDTPLVEECDILRLDIKGKSDILITAGNSCKSESHLNLTGCLSDDRLSLRSGHLEGVGCSSGLAGCVGIYREHHHISVLSRNGRRGNPRVVTLKGPVLRRGYFNFCLLLKIVELYASRRYCNSSLYDFLFRLAGRKDHSRQAKCCECNSLYQIH